MAFVGGTADRRFCLTKYLEVISESFSVSCIEKNVLIMDSIALDCKMDFIFLFFDFPKFKFMVLIRVNWLYICSKNLAHISQDYIF